MRLEPGTKILTVPNLDLKTDIGCQNRVENSKGIVIGHHDSHGLCYCVAHFRSGLEGGNSNIAYYEPHELIVISFPVPMTEHHFPSYEGFQSKKGEGISEGQFRWMIESFVNRRRVCSQIPKLDNTRLYAGQPLVNYCEHCEVLCDITAEDFICPPRKSCSMCEWLIKHDLMERAKSADA